MERDTEIHIPKTRRGGTFTDSKDVKLHANDFEWEAKVDELSPEERSLVAIYTSKCLDELARVEEAAPSWDSVPPRPWESHFASSKHHFPVKNYIVHAFPQLRGIVSRDAAPTRVLECGCGTGSTLLPIMRECTSTNIRFVGFDISPSALEHFRNSEVAQGYLARKQLTLFPLAIGTPWCSAEADAESPALKRQRGDGAVTLVADAIAAADATLENELFDAVLLIFVLSALPTVEKMTVAVRQLKRVMKPDGVLFFRDYALPDHNFFRFLAKMDNKVGEVAFAKGDGTTQAFFHKKFAAELFASAGLVEVDDSASKLTYHCNRIVNRKNGKRMDKIFINGTFKIATSS
ncbi:Methyltransferase domain containing protein [Novymonas esmeraldas]|uniref:tRNA N(3)-methylcytidine methyltransferase n=1 Tax=Novymonas esmeraldas TaxID=1808958 RepID=A0AAW0F187_9TRYP